MSHVYENLNEDGVYALLRRVKEITDEPVFFDDATLHEDMLLMYGRNPSIRMMSEFLMPWDINAFVHVKNKRVIGVYGNELAISHLMSGLKHHEPGATKPLFRRVW